MILVRFLVLAFVQGHLLHEHQGTCVIGVAGERLKQTLARLFEHTDMEKHQALPNACLVAARVRVFNAAASACSAARF